MTGGGRGIGAAIAQALATAGARVTMLGRTAGELEATAAALPGDARRGDGRRDGCEAGRARIRRGARGSGRGLDPRQQRRPRESRALAKSDEAFWREMLDVNLTGAYHCTRAAIRAMLAANWGRIVNVSSTAGLRGYAYCTAYCAAKHGVIGMTRALALEVAKTGITVNAVCPGYTDTGVVRDADAEHQREDRRAARPRRARRSCPSIRSSAWSRPEEVANAVLWLCSPGSESMNGQSIAIAGGEVT